MIGQTVRYWSDCSTSAERRSGYRVVVLVARTVRVAALRMRDDLMKPPAWRQRAACRGVDPDIFYPVLDEDAFEAKAICDSCAVQQPCLEWALNSRERDGVWGGATERERRRMIRQRRRTA
jgi:WhiB family redox-sensing transcriptional regulator